MYMLWLWTERIAVSVAYYVVSIITLPVLIIVNRVAYGLPANHIKHACAQVETACYLALWVLYGKKILLSEQYKRTHNKLYVCDMIASIKRMLSTRLMYASLRIAGARMKILHALCRKEPNEKTKKTVIGLMQTGIITGYCYFLMSGCDKGIQVCDQFIEEYDNVTNGKCITAIA